MAYEAHKDSARAIQAHCAVITLSDTRDQSNDASGARIKSLLMQHNHVATTYQVIRDEPDALERELSRLESIAEIDAILTTGGTGISQRDQTISVIERHIAIPLPGFGELFRLLSFEQIGSGAMLSRATAGITHGKLIFAMPGSTKAVELAMTRLILPELGHLISELRK